MGRATGVAVWLAHVLAAQTASGWLTTDDRKALLEAQPPVHITTDAAAAAVPSL